MLKIVPVNSNKELCKFVKFNIELYKDNPYAVPQLILDEMNTLNPKINPAFDFCEAQCFLCYRDKKIVGRIAAIINHKANETWGKLCGRFGFIDFIEDFEVAKLLIDTAQTWLRERGMDEMEGPMGFTDLDQEGMLIKGFDQIGTMATIYNHPYYPQYMERMGFTKAVDWIECKVFTPQEEIPRITKVANVVLARTGVRIIRPKNPRKMIKDGWGDKLFDLTNRAMANIYGYSNLSERQIKNYVKQYLPLVRMEYVTLIVDRNNKLIAYGLGLPSLSKALQKAQGKIFPMGVLHLLKALKSKRVPIIDFLLISVDPEWQGRGVNAIIMKEFIENMQKTGTIYAESNPELESNNSVGDQWNNFNVEYHKRRRAFKRKIE